MKVKLRDVDDNPFRDRANNPIDPARVEELKGSIGSTTFWDNILARRKDGRIQIAYGHHRIEALRQLFPPDHEIDIPVRDLSDEQMLRIMANENVTVREHDPRVYVEAVRQAKAYLEAHPDILAKYDGRDRKDLVAGNRKAGKVVITAFLGKPSWNESRVGEALAAIDGADPEVIEKAPSLRHTAEISRVKDKNAQKQLLRAVLDGKPATGKDGKRRHLTAAETRKLVNAHGTQRSGAGSNGKNALVEAFAKAREHLYSALIHLEGEVKKGWTQADDRTKKLIRETLMDFHDRTRAFVTMDAQPGTGGNDKLRRVANG